MSEQRVSAQPVRVSRPNLLDNWYFIDPINQRGLLEYTNGYGIDRWSNVGSNSSVTLTNEGLHIVSNSLAGFVFDQLNEKQKLLDGKTVTASIMVKSATGAIALQAGGQSTSGVFSNDTAVIELIIKEFTSVNVPFIIRVFNNGPSADFVLVAAKLEEGEGQTLARKEGEKWVLNDPPPNYALELKKCRYYQKVISGAFEAVGTYAVRGPSENLICVLIPINEMRVTPNVTFIGTFRVISETNLFLISNIVPVTTASKDNYIVISIQSEDLHGIAYEDHGWIDLYSDSSMVLIDANP